MKEAAKIRSGRRRRMVSVSGEILWCPGHLVGDVGEGGIGRNRVECRDPILRDQVDEDLVCDQGETDNPAWVEIGRGLRAKLMARLNCPPDPAPRPRHHPSDEQEEDLSS